MKLRQLCALAIFAITSIAISGCAKPAGPGPKPAEPAAAPAGAPKSGSTTAPEPAK